MTLIGIGLAKNLQNTKKWYLSHSTRERIGSL